MFLPLFFFQGEVAVVVVVEEVVEVTVEVEEEEGVHLEGVVEAGEGDRKETEMIVLESNLSCT